MNKHRVAAILDEIGTLLELQGENPFRCQAYHQAARAIEQVEGNLNELVAAGRLHEVVGVGPALQEKIATLVTTGRLPLYEELKRQTPPGLVELLRVPHLGPKKIQMLYEQLGIASLDQLKAACEAGRVAELPGFGEKTQQRILESITFLEKAGRRVLLPEAEVIALRLLEQLRDHPRVMRAELCGSLRRRKETVGNINLLVSSDTPKSLIDKFAGLDEVVEVAAQSETGASVVLYNGMVADLRVVPAEEFAFALHYYTGSKEHNLAMQARARSLGLELSEHGLVGDKKQLKAKDEADLFAALGLDDIPPELRENTGEIEAAAEHRLPRLVEYADLRGAFHCHTTWSDGGASVEEMALAAQRLGLEYLGIADHSQSLTIARGLTPERVRQQQAEIDAVNARLPGIRLLKGLECDILLDGRLDFDDDLLASFDYVIASVHSHFRQPEEEMTVRILRAISHPRVTMLGHATGRRLLKRPGYRVNLDQVLRAAAEHGTIVEINANPERLDLDWQHCKQGKALGLQFAINPDAHDPDEIGLLRFGIDVARRGWLEKGDILNTLPLEAVLKKLGKE